MKGGWTLGSAAEYAVGPEGGAVVAVAHCVLGVDNGADGDDV